MEKQIRKIQKDTVHVHGSIKTIIRFIQKDLWMNVETNQKDPWIHVETNQIRTVLKDPAYASRN
jgi:hypothetical protein